MAFELPILFLNVLNIFFAQRCPERMFVSFLWSPAQIHPKIYAEIFGYRMKFFFCFNGWQHENFHFEQTTFSLAGA